MTKNITISIDDFCEEFDSVNADTTVCFMISNNTYDFNLKCQKKNIDFWGMVKEGIRFFVEGAEIGSHGTIFGVSLCKKEEDEISIDYIFCNNKGKQVFFVSVLKE